MWWSVDVNGTSGLISPFLTSITVVDDFFMTASEELYWNLRLFWNIILAKGWDESKGYILLFLIDTFSEYKNTER